MFMDGWDTSSTAQEAYWGKIYSTTKQYWGKNILKNRGSFPNRFALCALWVRCVSGQNPLYYLWSRRTPPTRGGSRGSTTIHPRPWEFFMGIPWEFHGNIRYMYVGPNTTHDGGTSARIKTTADSRDGILGHGIQIQWRQPMATHLNDLGNNFLHQRRAKETQLKQ